MLKAFLPKSATQVVVYLEPINVRWGVQKLCAFCREVVGVEPQDAACFSFVNSRRDTLLLYFMDRTGEQILTKKLDKGSFLPSVSTSNPASRGTRTGSGVYREASSAGKPSAVAEVVLVRQERGPHLVT